MFRYLRLNLVLDSSGDMKIAESIANLSSHKKLALLGLALSLYTFYTKFSVKNGKKSRENNEKALNSSSSSQKRVGVNSRFVAQLRQLLPICIPGI